MTQFHKLIVSSDQSDSDSGSNGKLRRSVRSSFIPIEKANQKSANLAMDFGELVQSPTDEFDITSNRSVEEEEDIFNCPKTKAKPKSNLSKLTKLKDTSNGTSSPLLQNASATRNSGAISPAFLVDSSTAKAVAGNVKDIAPKAEKPSPTALPVVPVLPGKKEETTSPTIEVDRCNSAYHQSHDDSTLTASDAGSLKGFASSPPRKATVPAIAISVTTQHGETTVDTLQNPVSPNISDTTTRSSTVAKSMQQLQQQQHDMALTQSIMEDLDSTMSGIAQEKLLDRLDQVASSTCSSNIQPATYTSPSKSAPKTIVALKPPPSLPPKVPRYSKCDLSTSRDSQSSQTPLSPQEEARILKQYEERLLQGGNFLNESNSTAASGTSDNLAMKLLSRLEQASTDPEFLSNHHGKDPPLASSTSFGSLSRPPCKVGVPSVAVAVSARPAAPQKQQQRPNTSSFLNAADAYAAFMDTGAESTKDRSSSFFKQSRPLPGYNENTTGDTSKSSGSKLNYLYSQDNEFENSILSPPSVCSNSAVGTMDCSHFASKSNSKARPQPRSSKKLYRSDAINAFLERADCTGSDPQTIDSPHRSNRDRNSGSPLLTEQDVEDTDDSPVEDQPRKMTPNEFLNLVASGCSGVPNKEAITEKLVAFEAGWSEMKTQVNEKIQGLEESWQNWNLNSLLQFPSSHKAEEGDLSKTEFEAARTSKTMGCTTVLTTPPSMTTAKQQHVPEKRKSRERFTPQEDSVVAANEIELCLNDNEKAPAAALPMDTSQDQVILGVVEELRNSKYGRDAEKIVIGSEEHEVGLALKNALADISLIDDANNVSEASSSQGGENKLSCLESSREDSEGGKVILDVEWDAVEASDDNIQVDLSDLNAVMKQDGNVYKAKQQTKTLRSPTSVLCEI